MIYLSQFAEADTCNYIYFNMLNAYFKILFQFLADFPNNEAYLVTARQTSTAPTHTHHTMSTTPDYSPNTDFVTASTDGLVALPEIRNHGKLLTEPHRKPAIYHDDDMSVGNHRGQVNHDGLIPTSIRRPGKDNEKVKLGGYNKHRRPTTGASSSPDVNHETFDTDEANPSIIDGGPYADTPKPGRTHRRFNIDRRLLERDHRIKSNDLGRTRPDKSRPIRDHIFEDQLSFAMVDLGLTEVEVAVTVTLQTDGTLRGHLEWSNPEDSQPSYFTVAWSRGHCIERSQQEGEGHHYKIIRNPEHSKVNILFNTVLYGTLTVVF